MKNLSEIIAAANDVISSNEMLTSCSDVIINGLCLDSRLVKPGELFFAFAGHQTDGMRFIDQAIDNGAVAVIADQPVECSIPLVIIKDLPQQLGAIAAAYYDYPSTKLTVVGVTGTNGKSSVCYLLAQALAKMNQTVGLMSTIGYGLFDQLSVADRTTANAIIVQQQLAHFVEQQVTFAVIEVSSHALVQGRVNAVAFDYAVFTNLSRDHLDYHQSMTAYAEAKKGLFQLPSIKKAVLNIDDQIGNQWSQRIVGLSFLSYSASGQSFADIVATKVTDSIKGLMMAVNSPWGSADLTSQLIGRINVDNLLAVLSSLCQLGFSLLDSVEAMSKLTPVPGRMELFCRLDQAKVVVDYAHTPDALLLALKSLRPYADDLWCVFGCGGDRDRGKRPLMAKISEQYADHIILTKDNCRSEPLDRIIGDICSGFCLSVDHNDHSCGDNSSHQHHHTVSIELNRRRAIAQALRSAQPQDIILLAGKGHEYYEDDSQYSDIVIANKLLDGEIEL